MVHPATGAPVIRPWRIAMWGAIAAAIVTPAVAMRFTDEVAWTASDFAFAAGLLIGAGLVYELASRKVGKLSHRLAIGAAVLAVVLLVWAQGAVGIF